MAPAVGPRLRTLVGHRRVVLGLDPGFGIGHMAEGKDRTLRQVGLGGAYGPPRFGDLEFLVGSGG
ncbi:hypothetical protein [Actinomadura sp. CNU-125]|uniref:hypothetical protein n=1 Tax=Actinomadura sp. CNU-125 TaxID=1904961 RepID=UPI0021CC80EB|nr:hypothetical protein [Actinomadura sp. CNU-125]